MLFHSQFVSISAYFLYLDHYRKEVFEQQKVRY